jgi:hypothetical protein
MAEGGSFESDISEFEALKVNVSPDIGMDEDSLLLLTPRSSKRSTLVSVDADTQLLYTPKRPRKLLATDGSTLVPAGTRKLFRVMRAADNIKKLNNAHKLMDYIATNFVTKRHRKHVQTLIGLCRSGKGK